MMPLEAAKYHGKSLKLVLIATFFYAPAHGQTLAPESQRELLLSTLWVQSAPEYQLSTKQTLLQAQRSLKAAITQTGTAAMEQPLPASYRKLPPAVIVDLDETMLDNSDYQGYLLRSGAPWSAGSWADWMNLGQARAVPGAVEFANAVVKAGAAIFYVSNRECIDPGHCPAKAATMANMKRLRFPQADISTVFMFRNENPDWRGDKVSRRAAIAKHHRIVMLVGDDMQDFMAADDLRQYQDPAPEKSAAIRAVVDKNLGKRWFLLPNPMYGSWERALPRTLEQKYAVLRAADLKPRAISLATWNMEWLISAQAYDEMLPLCTQQSPPSDQRTFPCTSGRPPLPRRGQTDIDAMARVAERIPANVVALQEADGADAAALVFRQGWKIDCFVSRKHPQKVGFAVREGTPYRCNGEYKELDVDGYSRAGADITIFPDTPNAVRLLAVHLKSGCARGPLDLATKEACATLRRQIPVLEKWIDARASEGAAFAVLGDFNRVLELDSTVDAGLDETQPRALFSAISDGKPSGATLKRASEIQKMGKCSSSDQHPPGIIDDVLIGESLLNRASYLSLKRVTFDDAEAATLKLSDHCPLVLTIDGARD